MSEAIASDTHRTVKNLTASGFTEAQAEALANEQAHLLNMTESGRLLLADDLMEAIQAGCAVVRCVATTNGYGRGDGHDHESRHLDNNRRVHRARCVAARTVQRNKLTFRFDRWAACRYRVTADRNRNAPVFGRRTRLLHRGPPFHSTVSRRRKAMSKSIPNGSGAASAGDAPGSHRDGRGSG